jgi:hypothetical protein
MHGLHPTKRRCSGLIREVSVRHNPVVKRGWNRRSRTQPEKQVVAYGLAVLGKKSIHTATSDVADMFGSVIPEMRYISQRARLQARTWALRDVQVVLTRECAGAKVSDKIQ